MTNHLDQVQHSSVTIPQYAFYGGSFNPIHLGHLAIVQYLITTSVEKIIVMPTGCSPFKRQETLLPAELRWNMVNAVFHQWDRIQISDLEIYSPSPSYTYQTLTQLNNLYPEVFWHIVMGIDTYYSFHQWKQAKEILSYGSLWVIPRRGMTSLQNTDMGPPHFSNVRAWFSPLIWDKNQQVLYHDQKELVRFLDFHPVDVSSSAIREGRTSHDFIPDTARTYYETYLKNTS